MLLAFDDAPSLDNEGYQQTENGYGTLREGGIQVSVRTDMPGVTPAMWEWWFGWHGSDSRRYKLWHPRAHVAAHWEDGGGDGANHFAGGYVVLSQEWKTASATVDADKFKKSEAAPSIGLGYNFALDARSTIGLKLTVDAKNGEYGVGGETEVKEKSHYSIAVEPGYAINDKVLVFGILAYHKAKAELVVEPEGSLGQTKVSGFGYGIGAKYALSDHLFLMAEVQKVDYRRKLIGEAEVKPSSTVVALGLGYHF